MPKGNIFCHIMSDNQKIIYILPDTGGCETIHTNSPTPTPRSVDEVVKEILSIYIQ